MNFVNSLHQLTGCFLQFSVMATRLRPTCIFNNSALKLSTTAPTAGKAGSKSQSQLYPRELVEVGCPNAYELRKYSSGFVDNLLEKCETLAEADHRRLSVIPPMEFMIGFFADCIWDYTSEEWLWRKKYCLCDDYRLSQSYYSDPIFWITLLLGSEDEECTELRRKLNKAGLSVAVLGHAVASAHAYLKKNDCSDQSSQTYGPSDVIGVLKEMNLSKPHFESLLILFSLKHFEEDGLMLEYDEPSPIIEPCIT